ncbi:MAG: helix-turn-helix transcriptional regulator [Spirochaetaceae bacterium]|nr:helix-turn-helix transcriptional regulator [Spirochaetaceae bacterium]
MTFYERYERICSEHSLDPCSQKAADLIGTTRSTISVWRTKKTMPKAEFITAIANAYGVSADYLLGRTDDPTDYSNQELIASMSGPVLDELNGDVKKAVEFHKAVDEDVKKEGKPHILVQYEKLDEIDQVKADAFIQGLLSADKYAQKRHA